MDNNSYDSNLWVYDIVKGKQCQLTAFNNESSFIWLEDNETILFQADREKGDLKKKELGVQFSQFYKINIHGGEAIKAFNVPMIVNSIFQIDEKNYFFLGNHKVEQKDFYMLTETEQEEELKAKEADKDYEVIKEIPFWTNGVGFTDGVRNRLYRYKSTNNNIEPITDDDTNVGIIRFNKAKDKLIFTANSYKGKAPLTENLYLYDLKTNKLKVLASDEFSYEMVDFIDDNNLILCGSDLKEYGINEDGRFYLLDIDKKVRTLITPDFDKSIWNSVGSDSRLYGGEVEVVDGDYCYFITTVEDSSYINRIDKKGNIEIITKEKGSVDCFDVNNNLVAMVAMRNQELQEVYLINNEKENKITKFNQWVNEELSISVPEKVYIETEPGVSIEGWVIKPIDFDENKKYPGILDIHGGPKTVYGDIYYHEMQLWASMGYFAFYCNPRGSDGRGRKFADIRGKYGTIDYDDLMEFTDGVLKLYPWIDSDHLGVTGGSYGGFMTNWIIGHTSRFKAAVSQRSISNWVSMFATTDIGYYFADDVIGATPWNDINEYWEHSPLKYADNVTTPTLFIHSEQDYRCWLSEGLQMFTALKYHGVEARLCMFRGENHELSRGGKPKHRIRRLNEITNWFEEYLK